MSDLIKFTEEELKRRPPSKINGKINPEYTRWYRSTLLGEIAMLKYRRSEKARACSDRYRESKKGKATIRRASRNRVRVRKETPEQYADRIMQELDYYKDKACTSGSVIRNESE